MDATPHLSSTQNEEMDRKDENAHDYSGSGMATPLQFVINNEPHLPRNREQKKLVRSHAKRQSRAVQKRKNTMPVHRRPILQKGYREIAAQSGSGFTLASTSTSTSTSIASAPQTPSTDTNVTIASSVGSESDICLTPESSYLASEDGETRSFSTSPEIHSPLPSLPSINSLQLDVHHFDRWMFDTSESISFPHAPEPDSSQHPHMLYCKMKEPLRYA